MAADRYSWPFGQTNWDRLARHLASVSLVDNSDLVEPLSPEQEEEAYARSSRPSQLELF